VDPSWDHLEIKVKPGIARMAVIEIAGFYHLQNVLDDLAFVGPDIVLDIVVRDGPSRDERENEHPAESERGPKTVVSRRPGMR